jgi:hypothetical protein
MNKIVLLFVLASFCFLGLAKVARKSTKPTGSIVGSSQLSTYFSDPVYQKSETVARSFYLEKTGLNLGPVVSISSQIVSGVKYFIEFSNGNKKIACSVWAQPWMPSYICNGCAPTK